MNVRSSKGDEPPNWKLPFHPQPSGDLRKTLLITVGLWAVLGLAAAWVLGEAEAQQAGAALPAASAATDWQALFSPARIVLVALLAAISAFYSAAEIAFFSLPKLQLKNMNTSTDALDRLVVHLMSHPGRLLTSMLMANLVANVLLTVALAPPLADLVEARLVPHEGAAFALAVVIATAAIVFFCEILPKVLVVPRSGDFARFSAIPVFLGDKLFFPLRTAALWITEVLFRVTHISKVKPAPFITDEEFEGLLTEGAVSGVIEQDEREMIQGILEFSDMQLREILVPRPDMVALRETATVAEALQLVRQEEYSRMPIYSEDLDHITGILYAKDLVNVAEGGDTQQPVKELARKATFVPETMSLTRFLRTVQKQRMHMAIVVDEFGGTEGLVTLQDALREVIGDIGEEDEFEEPEVVELGNGAYRVSGSLPLYELEELTGVPVEDEEHTTVAGFLMERTDKIPAVGDTIEHAGVTFTVEAVDGKRVSQLLIRVPQQPAAAEAG